MIKASKTKLRAGQEKFRQSLTSLSHHYLLQSCIECKCQDFGRGDESAGVASGGREEDCPMLDTGSSSHLCNRPTAGQS